MSPESLVLRVSLAAVAVSATGLWLLARPKSWLSQFVDGRIDAALLLASKELYS